ncbi:MAG: ABC transporter permease subunit [Nitrospinales bacterium]
MKNAWLIAKRDLGTYFNSPIFYVLTSVFLLLYSFIFFKVLSQFSFESFRAGQLTLELGMALSLNKMVVEPSLRNMSFVLLLLVPVITMRSFSEEKKNKSIFLLFSSPLHLRDILFGKFLACMTVVTLMILLTTYSMGFLVWYGNPEIGPIITGYAGLLLLATCFVSVGVFTSSLTDNQIVAAVACFGISLFMWLIGWGAGAAGEAWYGDVLQFLSLTDHLDRFLSGVLDTADVLYYLSFVSTGLFLTYQVLESNRWR